LEKDERSERWQVIEHPTLPQRPLKSGRLKMAGIALALAAMMGAGAIVAAETLDPSISGGHELAGIVDSQLMISIPYISTRTEIARGKRRRILIAGIVAISLLCGLAVALVYWLQVDVSWFDKSWLNVLTRPSL
jgi:uncharacterized protein involved in exopolysaccharide biosynthesis